MSTTSSEPAGGATVDGAAGGGATVGGATVGSATVDGATVGSATVGEGVGGMLRIPVDRELADRLSWLVRLRWFVILFGAAVLLVANRWLGQNLPMAPLWGTLGAVVLVNAFNYLVTQRMVGAATPPEVYGWLLHAQILCDLIALTVIFHFTGGLENPFSVYYVLVVAAGSILMTTRNSYLYAGLATALWVGLLVAEATGLLPHHNLSGFRLPMRYRELAHIVAESIVMATANLGVAYLVSNVVARLREGERQLFSANSACEIRAGELRVLNERLRDQERSRAQFIRLVTHELRAPVAAIRSYLRLILDGYVEPERVTEIVSKSEQRAGDQLALIEDLLDLARVRDPRPDTFQPVDMAAVLRDVLDLMAARIQDQELQVQLSIRKARLVVLADEAQMKQVWTNLVSNAVKYTPSGGKVAITLKVERGMVCGAVADTGIGIKPEELPHIFEDFYRTDTAKQVSRQGTGIGLSIVKGVVERYGGTVGVESEYGVGSTFRFTLPQMRTGQG